MKNLNFSKINLLLGLVLIFSLFFFSCTKKQRSVGGPYGCQEKTYVIPELANNIFYVSPDGDSESPGSSLEAPTSIESAFQKVSSGDAIILRGGVYRTGNLVFNQHIIMQPYQNEKPILKGTLLAEDWKQENDSLWSISWKNLFPNVPASWWGPWQQRFTPLHRFNGDMVFIDGEFLQSAGNTDELDSNTFYIDFEKEKIFLGINPANHKIEITAYNRALHRIIDDINGVPSDKKGPEIYGLEITQYADTAVYIEGNQPQQVSNDSEHGSDVVGTRFENCKITYASRIAAYLLGDSLVMKNCEISHTSTEGLYVVSSDDVLLEQNIFAQNNIENITGFFPSGVKIFNQCYRVTCRNNLITDHPNSNGLWYDVGNVDGVFVNNMVQRVGKSYKEEINRFRWRSGFFFEISKNVVCIGNVFKDCDNGIFILNSCNAEIYQNTLINSGVTISRDQRSAQGDHFGWHPQAGPDIPERIGHVFMNNILVGNTNKVRPLINIYQSDSLCHGTLSYQLKKMDFNLYIHQSNPDTNNIIIWKPYTAEQCELKLFSPKELNQYIPDFEQNSVYLKEYTNKIFVDLKNENFNLSEEMKNTISGSVLDENLIEVMGIPENTEGFVGAYPN